LTLAFFFGHSMIPSILPYPRTGRERTPCPVNLYRSSKTLVMMTMTMAMTVATCLFQVGAQRMKIAKETPHNKENKRLHDV
jgi:hypothetical protein